MWAIYYTLKKQYKINGKRPKYRIRAMNLKKYRQGWVGGKYNTYLGLHITSV